MNTAQEKNMRMRIFSGRLNSLLSEKRVKQKQLEVATRISQSTISRLLNGKQEPTADDAMRLAAYFGVSVEFLLTGTGGPREETPSLAAIQEWKHRAISAEQKLEAVKAGLLAFVKKI